MPISSIPHASNFTVAPRYQKIEQDPDTNFIIIDDVAPTGIEAHSEVNRNVAWLKIESNFQVAVLASEPSGLTALDNYQPWNRLRLFVAADETLVVLYRALPMNTANQQTVMGYQLDTVKDALYVKIDQSANTVTLYEGNGFST